MALKHGVPSLLLELVRNQLQKTTPGTTRKVDVEKAVRDLVDEHVESAGVYDIFKVAGVEKADLSILDDKFLQTLKETSPKSATAAFGETARG